MIGDVAFFDVPLGTNGGNLLFIKHTRRSEGTRIACLLFFYPRDIPMGYGKWRWFIFQYIFNLIAIFMGYGK
jgi:hypothetical protein